ncbi:MAG: LptF/LptG family permease, partial [Planctomycetota bacterium]
LILRARPDADAHVLREVVAIYRRGDGKSPAVVAVDSARPHFFTTEYGVHYLAVDVIGATGGLGQRSGTAERQAIPPMELPNPMEDKPRYYTLAKLHRGVRDPTIVPVVARKLAEVRRLIAHDLFCAQIAEDLADGGSWQFSSGGRTYVLQAPVARPTGSGSVELRADGDRPVCVSFLETDPERPAWSGQLDLAACAGPGGALASTPWRAVLPKAATASAGRIETDYDPRTDRTRASIVLTDAKLQPPGGGQITGRDEWIVHGSVARTHLADAQRITLGQLLDPEHTITRNKNIRSRIDWLRREIRTQRAELIAELNLRLSYAASCFLLVAFGAALGVVFRGGHLLSAFVLSVIPAAVVLVMILMGKEMARNRELPLLLGVGVIWAGVALLLGGCIWIYAHLARR